MTDFFVDGRAGKGSSTQTSIPCLYTLSLYESGSRVLVLSSYPLNCQGFVVLWPPRIHWLPHRLRIDFQDYSQMTSNRRLYSVATSPDNCGSLRGRLGQYLNLGVKLYSRNISTRRHLTKTEFPFTTIPC